MRLKATSSPWFPRLREAERGAARRLRLLDPARCARLDDVRDQQVRIEGAGIEQVVGLGVLVNDWPAVYVCFTQSLSYQSIEPSLTAIMRTPGWLCQPERPPGPTTMSWK